MQEDVDQVHRWLLGTEPFGNSLDGKKGNSQCIQHVELLVSWNVLDPSLLGVFHLDLEQSFTHVDN